MAWKRFPWVGWSDARLGARLAVVAVAAMLVARLMGLHAFYWAGISALIVSAGSPGGSLVAGMKRSGATLVGLGVGVAMVRLLGHSFLAAGVAIALAILISQGVGLKSAARVAALTTLFPISVVMEGQGLQQSLATSFSRAENVLIGCAVTMVLDWLLWPERPGAKLRRRLELDALDACRQSAELLLAYVGLSGLPVAGSFQAALAAQGERSALLNAAMAEPEEGERTRAGYLARAEVVQRLSEQRQVLGEIVPAALGDRVQGLLREPLAGFARALAAWGGPGSGVQALETARKELDLAYQEIRGERGTLAHPVEEVFRFLGAIQACHGLEAALRRLETGP
nr:FUSC family protein [uncultured Holophaga sp.]